jgi:hypothetical protein
MAVLAVGLLAAAGMALHPAHAAKPQAEAHDCPAGTKWSCQFHRNPDKPSNCDRHPTAIWNNSIKEGCHFPDIKVCGCN